MLYVAALSLVFASTADRMPMKGAAPLGFILGIQWLIYTFAALVCFALLFARGRRSVAQWMSTWQAVGALVALGFFASLPLAIAGGFASNRAAVALVSFILGVSPVVSALAAERLGALPARLMLPEDRLSVGD